MPPIIPILGGFVLGLFAGRSMNAPDSRSPIIKSVAKRTIKAGTAVSRFVDKATTGVRGFAAGIKEDLEDASAEARAESESPSNEK